MRLMFLARRRRWAPGIRTIKVPFAWTLQRKQRVMCCWINKWHQVTRPISIAHRVYLFMSMYSNPRESTLFPIVDDLPISSLHNASSEYQPTKRSDVVADLINKGSSKHELGPCRHFSQMNAGSTTCHLQTMFLTPSQHPLLSQS